MIISNSFEKPFFSQSRFLILYGGAGAGKSEFAARKLIYRCIKEDVEHRFLIIRKVGRSLKESVYELVKEALREENLKFKSTETPLKIELIVNGRKNEFLFAGIDDPEKIKSIKRITGIWIEEATELTENDIEQLNLRLREPIKSYHQIIMTFNPVISGMHIKKNFIDVKRDDTEVYKFTYLDNPIKEVRERYKKVLENLNDDIYKSIYLKGEWAIPKGLIFKNIKFVDNFDIDIKFEVFGLDFGFINPTALVGIYKKEDKLYVKEFLYKSGLDDRGLIEHITNLIPKNHIIYADSASPEKINVLINNGFNVFKAKKDVQLGIHKMLNFKEIIMLKSDINLINEFSNYKWTERKNQIIEIPVKYNDHLIDATRYAVMGIDVENQVEVMFL